MSVSSGHDGLVCLNGILAIHLLSIDAGHCQAAVSQQALDVENVETIPDRLSGECAAKRMGVTLDTSLSL